MARSPFRGGFAALLLVVAAVAAGCGPSIEQRLAEVRALQERQQFEASLAPLRSVLADEPGQPEASFRLGLALVKTGQPSGAVFPLREAADSEAFAVEAGLLLAQVLAATGNTDQAHAAVSRVLERDPDQVEALALRVQTHHRRGDYEAMLADAERVSRLGPGARGLGLRVAALEALGRFDEEREVLAALEALHRKEGDLPEAARACAVRAASFEKSDGNLTRGVASLDACLAEYPTQPIVLETATRVLPGPRVLGLWRKASDAAPESLDLRLGYARQLGLAGRANEASAVTRAAAEDFRTFPAWLALADLETAQGHPDAADAALRSAAAAAPEQAAAMLVRRADLRIASGDLDGAEQLAKDIADPALASVVRGHVQLERGALASALALLEKALETYPSHVGARTLAGRAAERLGQTDRALAHYREAVRTDPGLTAAGLWAGLLASSLGRHAEAAEYLARHLASMTTPPDAATFAAAIRATQAAGMTRVTAGLLEKMGRRPDLAAALAVEKAWLAEQAEGGEAAVRSLLASGLDLEDPANEAALRALVDAELASGHGEQALARIDAALRRAPERASLRDARGRVLLRLGRSAEAKAAFARAVASEPGYGPARAGLGVIAVREGDLEGALQLFDEAARAPTPDPDARFRAAQAARKLGRHGEDERRYREVLLDQPDHAGANNDLASILAERKQDLDGALALAERAVGLAPSASTFDTLAFVQMQRGEGDAARRTLEDALEKQAGEPMLLYRLGLVRKASGDREGAANAFRQALEAGAFPQAEAARTELASLEASRP